VVDEVAVDVLEDVLAEVADDVVDDETADEEDADEDWVPHPLRIASAPTKIAALVIFRN
jgi:hypothetical protein